MSERPGRQRIATLGLVAASVLVALFLAEGLLRIVGYRFSPIVFLAPENPDDHRPFHMGGWDMRLRTRPLTVADPDLLWRPDPRASNELTVEGFRGEPIPDPRPSTRTLIVALGDSNTLGPLGTRDHWPGFLQDLLRANQGSRSFQVVNAGVYGYSAFQGLRRFRQIRRFRPDVVYFSFGANDAQPVSTTDARYAARIEAVRQWNDLRLAAPLFNLAWRVGDLFAPRGPRTLRVPLEEYRQALQAFVEEARASGSKPILLTRPFLGSSSDPGSLLHDAPQYNRAVEAVAAETGAPLLDAWALLDNEPDRFTDAIHNDRVGYRRIAEAALRQLHALGLVETDDRRDLASSLDLAAADERRLELGPGFWLREAWPATSGGRWTKAEATVTLARPASESQLVLDLSCYRPTGPTRGRIEVDGRFGALLPQGNGHHRLRLALPRGGGASVDVRFLVDSSYRPCDLQPGGSDCRVLGVFLHAVSVEPMCEGCARPNPLD
jgi:lysophospholipase L1-like esterase